MMPFANSIVCFTTVPLLPDTAAEVFASRRELLLSIRAWPHQGNLLQIPEAPKEQMVFMEDLPEDEQDHSGLSKYGAGISDYGSPADSATSTALLWSSLLQ